MKKIAREPGKARSRGSTIQPIPSESVSSDMSFIMVAC